MKVDHKFSPKLKELLKEQCPFPKVAKQELDKLFADMGYDTPANEYIACPEIFGELRIGEGVSDEEQVKFIYCWQIVLEGRHLQNRELQNQFNEMIQSLIERKIVSNDDVTITNTPATIAVIPDYDNAGRYYCLPEEVEDLKQFELKRIEEIFSNAKIISIVTNS